MGEIIEIEEFIKLKELQKIICVDEDIAKIIIVSMDNSYTLAKALVCGGFTSVYDFTGPQWRKLRDWRETYYPDNKLIKSSKKQYN